MEDFVSFEMAKKLKEKGYPQASCGQWSMSGTTYFDDGRFYEEGCICNVEYAYTAPRIDQVLKWLREKKMLYLEISLYRNEYCACIVSTNEIIEDLGLNKIIWNSLATYDNYEKAALTGITYCLNDLI